MLFRSDKVTGKAVETSKLLPYTQREFQEEVPLPAYGLFDKEIKEIIENINARDDVPVKAFPFLTMRGCPFACTFCAHQYGKKLVRKDWPGFFDEIEILINKYGLEGIFSYDSNMFYKKHEAMEFAEIYQQRKHTFKSCVEMRPTFGDKEMFDAIFDAGVRVMLFGYESGSQYMLDRMKKGFKLSKMKEVIQAAATANINIDGNFIFGTPGENEQTIQESYEFMKWLDRVAYEQKESMEAKGLLHTSRYVHSILTPTPGSNIYNIAIEEKLIKDEEKYLIHLSDDKLKERAKGSTFKLKLFFEGGDVNMSEFPSKRTMIYYVDYILNKALFVKTTYSEMGLKRLKLLFKYGYKLSYFYGKYFMHKYYNLFLGKKGFFYTGDKILTKEQVMKKIEKRRNINNDIV